jgi:hypothetical protein
MAETYADAQKEYDELKAAYTSLQNLYKKHFPKVDPRLLQEIISHTLSSKDNKDRMYSLQIITKKGTDPQKARTYFLSRTGKVPGSYESGSHYVINVFPTLDMIKDIQNYPEVEHITGDYTFGSSAVHSIHMHRGEDEQSRIRED